MLRAITVEPMQVCGEEAALILFRYAEPRF
jgi:hypothetical protein